MPDDLDIMLQGEGSNPPSASQAGAEKTGSNSEIPNEGTEGHESEEVEFNQLTGDSQDRFRKIYRERQDAVQERDRLRQLISQQAGGNFGVPPPPSSNPAVREAIGKLDAAGIATKDFVQSQIENILAKKTFFDELDRLETSLDGTDGRPKFVREEYEDYINRHPQYKGYLPVDVYSKMYEEELFDWKSTSKGNGKTTRSTTLRPTRTSARESKLTPEDIENKLKSLPEPQRSQWYVAHEKEINEAMSLA